MPEAEGGSGLVDASPQGRLQTKSRVSSLQNMMELSKVIHSLIYEKISMDAAFKFQLKIQGFTWNVSTLSLSGTKRHWSLN